MNARDVLLIGSLIEGCDSLLPVLQDHLNDYDELLPHLFMADVTRWLVERYEANRTTRRSRGSLIGLRLHSRLPTRVTKNSSQRQSSRTSPMSASAATAEEGGRTVDVRPPGPLRRGLGKLGSLEA
jgi:hypothetical protein